MLSLPYNIKFQKTDYVPLVYKTSSPSCVLFTLFYYNFVILNKIITFATDSNYSAVLISQYSLL